MAIGKYREWLENDKLLILQSWARDGLTDEQIAKNMGIGVRTLYEWKNSHKQISQAIKMGKEVVDIQVENALLKRALGYKYTDTKIIDDGRGHQRVETFERNVEPDVGAICFWLKNRRPDKWRDKHEIQNIDERVEIHDDL